MKKLFLLFLALSVISVYSQDNNYVQGEIIVMLKYGADVNRFANDFKGMNLRIKEPVVEYMNIWLCEYENNLMQPDVALSQIRGSSLVAIAQFNHYVTERSVNTFPFDETQIAVFPNDPSFGQQWSLNNTGQSGGTPDADVDGPEAWNLNPGGLTAAGDSIIVAIVDGGAYLTHPDIKFWKNYAEIPSNGIDDDTNGYIDDFNGWNAVNQNGTINGDLHGTHCSGIAGAIGNNSLGVSGVNWNVKIMPVRGSSGQEAVVVRAYGYVLKQRRLYNQSNGLRGAFVVSTNSSFGVDYGQPSNYPLWCAFYDSLGSAGILNACATANLNINIDVMGDIPTACPSPWMVSVTNTTHIDRRNTGAAWGLLTIDLGAPGTNIYNTTTSGSYGNLTGTSMATPHVAGGIAFMYSVAPLSWLQQYKANPGPLSLVVKDKILLGVDPKPSMQDSTVSGGRLNLYNSALLMQGLVGINGNNNSIPHQFRLYQNYPNPFNPSTSIQYDVPKTGFVSLKVYDALGREVYVLVNGLVNAGSYNITWDASNFTSGIYFYKLEAEGFLKTVKMALIK